MSFRLLAEDGICFNCMGLICDLSMKHLSDELRETVQDRFPGEIVSLTVTLPPIFNFPRMVLKECCLGFSKLPNMEDVLERNITFVNSDIRFGHKATATIELDVQISLPFDTQERMCRTVNSEFKSKKRKRTYFGFQGGETATPPRDVTDWDLDQLMKRVKNLDRDTEGQALLKRWSELMLFMRSSSSVSPQAASSSSVGVNSASGDTGKLHAGSIFDWKVTATRVPLYVMGRYLKYARDVPQSPWFLAEDDDGVTVQDTEGEPTIDAATASAAAAAASGDGHRKGRASIEEIITSAVLHFVSAEKCSLHACGREDIDVRMLGNGRPFVCKIMGATTLPTADMMAKVGAYINSKQGLNSRGDIAIATYNDSRGNGVTSMALADELVWRNMQAKAEGKHKAYRCVIHSKRVVTPQMLKQLELLTADSATNPQSVYMPQILEAQKPIEKEAEKESLVVTKRHVLTAADVVVAPSLTSAGAIPAGAEEQEEEAADCPYPLRIFQKTPLRVLHRRSLLARTRYISNIQTCFINQHCFLMTVATTAGTYVKELVHGDCGRTVPSVASLFDCPVHMLQLDVVYLFDDAYRASCRAAGITAANDRDKLYCTPATEFDSTAAQMDRHWSLVHQPLAGLGETAPPEKCTEGSKWKSMSWDELKRCSLLTMDEKSKGDGESKPIEAVPDPIRHYESACYFAHTATDSYVTYELVPTRDSPKRTVINILHTYTNPQHRGKGIGRLLVNKVLEIANSRDYILWNNSLVNTEHPLSTTCWFANVALEKNDK